jgi:hypothetical protein
MIQPRIQNIKFIKTNKQSLQQTQTLYTHAQENELPSNSDCGSKLSAATLSNRRHSLKYTKHQQAGSQNE